MVIKGSLPSRLTPIAAVVSVVGWFLFLAHRALDYGFNPDDVQSFDWAISRPLAYNLESCLFFWNGYVRPLGTLFYLVIYRVFGYWAPPFRIAAFLLIVLNLGLVYRFGRVITKSYTAAALVLLLSCFHGQMWDIYGNTGTVYDLLCQLFFLLALGIWFHAGPAPAWRMAFLAGLLTVGTVESKEIGVVLPAVLLMADVLFRPRSIRSSGIAVSAAVSLFFLLGRFAQRTAVTGNPAYTPIVEVAHFFHATAYYFNLLLNTGSLGDSVAVTLLAFALVLALVLRNRPMLFGFGFYFVSLLPLCFAPLRMGYVLYIPFTGAALYAVALFTEIRDCFPARHRLRPTLTAAFALSIMVSQFLENRALIAKNAAPGNLPQLEALTTGFRRAWPKLQPGSVVMLVNDPFYGNPHIPAFALHALYNDPSLTVRQIRWNPERGPEQLAGAQNALLFLGTDSWRFGSRDETGRTVDGRPPAVMPVRSALGGLNVVRDVGGAMADGTRWALSDPELAFTVPAFPPGETATFTMDFDIPQAILDHTGPLKLSFQVGERPPDLVTYARCGGQQYSVPISTAAGPLLRIRIHATNPYVSSDGTKLSFLLKDAGITRLKYAN